MPAVAHTVDYQVDHTQAVVVTVRLGEEIASYSEYKIFPPDQTDPPFQLGRTDAQGRLAFLPDRLGTWTVLVEADSQHGLHGAKVEIQVDDKITASLATRPLVARHTRLVVGISLLIGIFGLTALWRSRRPRPLDHGALAGPDPAESPE